MQQPPSSLADSLVDFRLEQLEKRGQLLTSTLTCFRLLSDTVSSTDLRQAAHSSSSTAAPSSQLRRFLPDPPLPRHPLSLTATRSRRTLVPLLRTVSFKRRETSALAELTSYSSAEPESPFLLSFFDCNSTISHRLSSSAASVERRKAEESHTLPSQRTKERRRRFFVPSPLLLPLLPFHLINVSTTPRCLLKMTPLHFLRSLLRTLTCRSSAVDPPPSSSPPPPSSQLRQQGSKAAVSVGGPPLTSNKWLELPDELWLRILASLEAPSYFDLKRVGAVCRKMERLVQVR